MITFIPKILVEPPDWFPTAGRPGWLPASVEPNRELSDPRWSPALLRASGEGGQSNWIFRALHYIDTGRRQFVYLAFRVRFTQALDSVEDSVFLGLHKHGSTEAMVIQLNAHAAAPTFSSPPQRFSSGKLWLATSNADQGEWGAWKPAKSVKTELPQWLQDSAYTWVHAADAAPAEDQPLPEDHDPNNRWAIQMLIPIAEQPATDDGPSPDLGSYFDIWYLIRGALSTGAIVIHGENRTDGAHTKDYDLTYDRFPTPEAWEEFGLSPEKEPPSHAPTAGKTDDGNRILRADIRMASLGFSSNMVCNLAPVNEGKVEISTQGYPSEIYLAIEKINLPRRTPSGTNEGHCLEHSVQRLIMHCGIQAEKLRNAQMRLADAGDYGSGAELESLLGKLRHSWQRRITPTRAEGSQRWIN